ncbi:branched-chain amino acid ABC transporter permease [Amycolatopsis viridis]|uniref:Branched-chain amino acid transport system permease protein n=1 Tax=Amycolatopsis viridis TaxID=185678 RepID=A0ABX0SND5_9PSEU|nr:branched-chain amino acid ABC transporter permease [Amycolatopsis viridis]NIH78491.1 branched-chain amino acid transport system permease protein [Amycolatopsis viridis]
MHELVQLAVGGLFLGGIYVLIAIGMSTILSVTGILHIAHGANLSLCALTFSALASTNILIAVLATTAVSLAFTMASYEFLYRPIGHRQTTLFPLFLVSFGLWIVGSSVLTLIFSATASHPRTSLNSTMDIGWLHLLKINLLAFGVAIACYAATRLFLAKTMTGSLMRAVACNRDMADVWGTPRRRAERVAFAMAALLAVPAGIFVAYTLGAYPTVGDTPLLIAFSTVILGGVGSIAGAAGAALLFGVIQGVAVWKLPATWQDGVVFGVFLLLILVSPRGLATLRTRRPAGTRSASK